ncbi:transposable element Tc1 transposase [Trichonephila clavipes]|nr:transposable element Tc1 transposase [Trichonephila clavipes]
MDKSSKSGEGASTQHPPKRQSSSDPLTSLIYPLPSHLIRLHYPVMFCPFFAPLGLGSFPQPIPSVPTHSSSSPMSADVWFSKRTKSTQSRAQGLENISLLFSFQAEIVEVEISGVAIYRPFGEFRRAKSYWDLEIGSCVGRNQTTVMRTCDRWMQEGTTGRRGRSYPPQCTTSSENRQIVRMAVTDRSVTSQTVAQPIECVTHHSLSTRTIRRRLQQSGLSARRPLLGLPLTQNHRRLRRQWCDERRMWAAEWNEVVFTDESRICLQHHDGRIRVWRHRGERMLNSCVMHRHTGSAPDIMGLAAAIFQQDDARPHVARVVQRFFVNHQIELLPWPARSPEPSPIENMWSMVAERLTQITPSAATPDQLWQYVEAAWSAVPQEHIQSLFESMPRRVAAVSSINGGYSGY